LWAAAKSLSFDASVCSTSLSVGWEVNFVNAFDNRLRTNRGHGRRRD